MESIIKKNFLTELQGIDWDFVGERTADSALSFHWYPARFVPQIPSNLIGYFTEKGDTVLDPFCGSGTSLVEAFRLDRKSIGVDINPVATLITRARLTSISNERFQSFITNITTDIAHRLLAKSDNTLAIVPNLEENQRWYHPETLAELASIYSAILELEGNSPESTISRCCFSAVLNRVCSQDRHFGWICDGVHPTEYKYKNASSAFNEKLVQFKDFLTSFQRSLRATEPRIVSYDDVQVHQADARNLRSIIGDNSIDLVLTSPPYLSVTDYNKSFRLTTLWFGSDSWQILPQSEIGARFKRGRKNGYEDYIEDTRKYVTEIRRVLRSDKYLCLVVGESSSHHAYIESLVNICHELGFRMAHNIRRNISIKRRLYPRVATEEIIILIKEN